MMAQHGGTVLDAIHNEMRNKKLLISNSDSDRDEFHLRKDEPRIKKKQVAQQTKVKMARNQSNEGSMTSGVHSACEHEMAGGGSEDSRSSTSPMDHFAKNVSRRSKGKKVQSCYVSSTSGEDDEPDIVMDDNELVFMTEQLSRLRTKEKKQKIAEARLTVTEAKLMEFAAKLAARKSKVEENHGRLKSRKNRIREKEEKIRELEQELNNLDDEVKRRNDILREKEKNLQKSEHTVSEKETNIIMREQTVSEKLKDIESRQQIIERKENMIREMSQLLVNQEVTSTRELNFHTRRFNRCHDDARRHASDEEVYDTFHRSRSAADLTDGGTFNEIWISDGKLNGKGLSFEKAEHFAPSAPQKKQKTGFQRIFANMKKSKSIEKLNGEFVHREIECNSTGENSGGEKSKPENEKQRKKTKKSEARNERSAQGPEPPARNQSIDYKPAPLLHHPKMIQQMHQQNHHEASMKFFPQIAQFNNPQFLFNPQDHISAFQQPCEISNQKSVSWQEESCGAKRRSPERERRCDRKRDSEQKKMCASQEYLI